MRSWTAPQWTLLRRNQRCPQWMRMKRRRKGWFPGLSPRMETTTTERSLTTTKRKTTMRTTITPGSTLLWPATPLPSSLPLTTTTTRTGWKSSTKVRFTEWARCTNVAFTATWWCSKRTCHVTSEINTQRRGPGETLLVLMVFCYHIVMYNTITHNTQVPVPNMPEVIQDSGLAERSH